MKRYLALILTIVMALGAFTACGKDKSADNALADKGLDEILAAVYEKKTPEFKLTDTKVDLTDENMAVYFTGLSKEDGEKVEEALASEPAMSSQAYSLVLLRVKDEKDAQAIAAAVKDGVDTRKWICVEADDVRACAHGDVVMFIMMSSEFADSLTADQMVEAFKETAGGSLSVDLK
ncbi:MAG: hypothetical protein Q4F21_01295 [Lachnospiraceae bacterium]|nr:hypothetical protein [Lachnospiraceae bacterium]